jgi:hypothetical protein
MHYTKRDEKLGMQQNKLLRTKIYHAIAENTQKSIEYNTLRLKKIDTLGK